MEDKRKPYKRIAANFESLLTEEGRAGLREAVAASDADWYETAARIFDLGVAEWRLQRDADRVCYLDGEMLVVVLRYNEHDEAQVLHEDTGRVWWVKPERLVFGIDHAADCMLNHGGYACTCSKEADNATR